jgi:hypothetical protein
MREDYIIEGLRNMTYEDSDGVCHMDSEGLLGSYIDLCGCGNPEEALKFIRLSLSQIDKLKTVWQKEITYENWEKENKEIYFNSGIEYFTYYMLDNYKLTEHGGSVPGWLSEKGKILLHDLNIWYEELQEEMND